METNDSKTNRYGHPNRILLSKENLIRIDDWMEKLQKGLKGLKITRADVVNHILQSHSPDLSSEEMHQIGRLFFDEMRFATWAVQALKEAKARGEDTTLQDLISQFGAASK